MTRLLQSLGPVSFLVGLSSRVEPAPLPLDRQKVPCLIGRGFEGSPVKKAESVVVQKGHYPRILEVIQVQRPHSISLKQADSTLQHLPLVAFDIDLHHKRQTLDRQVFQASALTEFALARDGIG